MLEDDPESSAEVPVCMSDAAGVTGCWLSALTDIWYLLYWYQNVDG